MTEFEKKISFLNRYFVYKKVRHVNESKIEIELGEYQDDERVMNQSLNQSKSESITSSEKEKEKEKEKKSSKSVPKIRKLNTKLLLVPATEALEENEVKDTKKRAKKEAVVADLSNMVLDINESKEEAKKPRKITKKATKLIIEDE